MKKLFFLIIMSLFIISNTQAADSNPDNIEMNQETVLTDIDQNIQDGDEMIPLQEKLSKKEFRKYKRDLKKEIKRILKTLDTTMMLVGAGLLIFGLLLYLVVTSATWLGIAVMVLGLVLLLYGVLKRFF
mgnify:CR=1 FL=1